MKKFACFLLLPLVCATVWARGSDLWFPVGEKMVFRIYWGVIPVGTAEIWSEWVEEDGVRLLALRAQGRSGRVLRRIFPVDDFVESIVDPDTFLPLRYVQRLAEGRHFRHDKMVFDHAKCKAYWTSEVKGGKKVIDIGVDTRDPLTLTYYMRSRGLAVGRAERFLVVSDEKVYELHLTGLKHEMVNVKGKGKVRCLKVEPQAKFGEVFIRGGKVMIWFSADSRCVCTRATGKVPVASVKAILEEVTGPGASEWPPQPGEGVEGKR